MERASEGSDGNTSGDAAQWTCWEVPWWENQENVTDAQAPAMAAESLTPAARFLKP